MYKKILIVLISLLVIIQKGYSQEIPKKIYWVIFDGLRAEDELFNIYKWAEEGKLPNIKKIMQRGSYGYCIPVFPTQSPVCYASILTGTYPETHGVTAAFIRQEGSLFDKISYFGFSSLARKVPAIWQILEDNGKKICLLSMPGSTPPQLKNGVTIRGRWGLWGIDFSSMIFDSGKQIASNYKLRFDFLRTYPEYSPLNPAEDWHNAPFSFSSPIEAKIERYGRELFLYIYDKTNNSITDYNHIAFSFDKKKILCRLRKNQWSKWIPTILYKQGKEISTFVRIKIIDLKNDGNFRVYIIYNPINETTVEPSYVSEKLLKKVGPMVDYPDDYWLILNSPEDKQAFLEEMNMAFNWHGKAIKLIVKEIKPDVFILDGLSPNQMLTAPFWIRYIDPKSIFFNDIDEKERNKLWQEVLNMYKKVDSIIGELLRCADKNTLVVVSADHGMTPLNRMVKLNNLFFKKGLLKFKKDEYNKKGIVDWENTKVILATLNDIYINPEGFKGKWRRPSGIEYERLRSKIKDILLSLKDERGNNPFEKIVEWEKAEEVLHLPKGRSGDLILIMKEGFFSGDPFFKNLTKDAEFFAISRDGGYKHALLADDKKALWTPFIIVGPNIKKNYRISKPVRQIDICPTIYDLLDVDTPAYVQGEVIKEIVEREGMKDGGKEKTEINQERLRNTNIRKDL